MTREEAIYRLKNMAWLYGSVEREQNIEAIDMAIEALSPANLKEEFGLAEAVQGWIPLSHVDDGLGTDFPYERDGEWVIVTDGNTISVERIKKDAYDHFFPNGRWFELENVIAWMPLPKPYREDGE